MDMKNNKVTGPEDDIPIEVWQCSRVAQAEIFVFLKHV